MLSLIGAPCKMIAKTLLKFLLLPSTIVSNIIEKGFGHSIAFIVSYVYLSLVEKVSKRRLDDYDFNDNSDLERNAFYMPKKEWKLDTPKEDRSELIENADDVFCFGSNTHSDGLAMHISRQPNGRVKCSLFLRLSNGKEYVLPEEHLVQQETKEEYTFGSSRMKLQCILPMRKWRIFFNGILKEHCPGSTNPPPSHHVAFTFLFSASSDIYDFLHDSSKTVLAHNAASSSSWESMPVFILQRIRNMFDKYEQCGVIYGTVKVDEDEEKEIYMWGNRGHYMGKTRNIKSGDFSEVYGYFENGAVIHLGFLTVQNIFSKFQYGYVMRPDGFIHPIETLSGGSQELLKENMKVQFSCGGNDYEFVIKNVQQSGSSFTKEYPGTGTIHSAAMSLREQNGQGFIVNGKIEELKREKASISMEFGHQHSSAMPLAVSFDESCCQNSELTGGKGSSLGKLYSMSRRFNKSSGSNPTPMFEVPKGVVVTTNAFKLFTNGALNKYLQKFQEAVWSTPISGSKDLCLKAVEEVGKQKLPEKIGLNIAESLRKIFGEDFHGKKFAVRSSATGEDTEQMSAAGQMETFLGLQSIVQITDAVIKCWASQFDFQAVEYKRRYGQLLNTPMAVVIQEMVACEVAGVAFTCDPLNGNPSYINITANYGLGESVVSASAEPDTIVLKRDLKNQLKQHSVEIGKKATKIVMDAESGTKEIVIEEQETVNCSLSEEMALRLGQMAVIIEEEYGSSRDLEWGIVNNKVYLFQSRPVTSIDTDTNFEIRHFFDSTVRTEKEFFSKANVGEVMPGATTPLGKDMVLRAFNMGLDLQRFVRYEGAPMPNVPYFDKRLLSAYNHIFFNLVDSFFQYDEANKELTEGLMLSLFGRSIDVNELISLYTERHIAYGKELTPAWKFTFSSKFYMYMAGILARRSFKVLNSRKLDPGNEMTARQLLNYIGYQDYITGVAMESHTQCSLASSNWNNSMMSFLGDANGGSKDNVLSDFGYLLSTSTEIESADVPSTIQNLGHMISTVTDPSKFKKLTTKEAYMWLQTSDTEAGKQFRLFLEKHGHRCLKEFDVHSDTWADDPLPLVKMIQNCVDPNIKAKESKEVPSFATVLSNLRTKLGFYHRLKLRFLLPNCRRGVREREASKSVTIKTFDKIRKVLTRLSDVMVQEGMLPNRKLLYFLCVEEINLLIKTRSPKIVARALKRQKCHEELDNLRFPELTCGITKPETFDSDSEDTSDGLVMTGIAVSQGVIKAPARVIMHLSEASSIQSGDILITYSTDIGWSPYFPLLSGVVTELGGLISHGAVVAREYGLPCVVGLHGATRAFKSGVAVSQGVIKAPARVIMHLSEASSIQAGDILIAYSTDIGWSPYFPLLSGVVTELGGLISHGAVVAREYGLPCVVGLHGATRAFKSGDLVVLDGTKGTLTRIQQAGKD